MDGSVAADGHEQLGTVVGRAARKLGQLSWPLRQQRVTA
jgi:hypothetical protein